MAILVKIIRMKANADADTIVMYTNSNAVVANPVYTLMRRIPMGNIPMNLIAAVAVDMTMGMLMRNIPMRANVGVDMTIMTMITTPTLMNPPNLATLPPCPPASLREFTFSIT